MEDLPADLWKAVFDFIPDHHFAARCTCRAWRARLGESPPRITPRTVLEARSDASFEMLEDAVGWDTQKANATLCLAASCGDFGGIERLLDSGATDTDAALARAAEAGQITAMHLLRPEAPPAANAAFVLAAKSGQTEAMLLLREWGANAFSGAFTRAAENRQIKAMSLLREWGVSTAVIETSTFPRETSTQLAEWGMPVAFCLAPENYNPKGRINWA